MEPSGSRDSVPSKAHVKAVHETWIDAVGRSLGGGGGPCWRNITRDAQSWVSMPGPETCTGDPVGPVVVPMPPQPIR